MLLDECWDAAVEHLQVLGADDVLVTVPHRPLVGLRMQEVACVVGVTVLCRSLVRLLRDKFWDTAVERLQEEAGQLRSE